MSTKDDNTSLEHSASEQLLVPRAASLGTKDGEWTTVPAYPRGSGLNQTDPVAYLHAIRRHWLLGAVLGVIFAASLGIATWFLMPTKYTATSWLRVAMKPETIVFDNTRGYNLQQEFDNYKNTQIQYLKSPLVLSAALGKPEISGLDIVKREKKDAVGWLQNELKISFPGEAEIMQVSLTDSDRDGAMKIVRAVVDVYMTEVVGAEDAKRREKANQLDRVYATKDNETRAKRAALNNLAESLNASDKETLSLTQQIAVQRHAEYRNQLLRAQFELGKLRGDLAAATAALKRVTDNPVSDFELQELIQRDQTCREHQQTLAQLQGIVAQQEQVARSGAAGKHVSRFAEQLATTQEQFDMRVNELRELVGKAKAAEIQEQVADLTIRVGLEEEREKGLLDEVNKQAEEVAKIGKSFVDIEMLRSEVMGLEMTLKKVGEQRDASRVELFTQPRVQLYQQAELPPSYDNPNVRIALSAFAGLTGLVLPICGIMWWDVRKQRINSPTDVAKGLGVPVMGSIPIIPGRAIRRLNAPGANNQQWNVRLTESIDSIAAKLLRNAAIEQTRVVLITSAVSGEGKTTLATQVAMSLARAGRRTVLVDFDLRRPAIDKAFQLPLHPGVSEALCGEGDILELVQQTGTKNLFVVTAGRCDRHALQALSNGVDQRLFEELRAEYEFVVVDGSPILPVADSRYLSQHVDSVILSVFRDYSRAPKVTAACEILETFGVHDVEAVVTSSTEDGYGVIER